MDFRNSLKSADAPDRHLHLALALAGQKRDSEAKLTLKKALDDGLSAEKLHPLERPYLASLKEKYGY